MKPMRLCGLWRARMVPVMALAIGLWFVPGEAVTQQPESKDTEKPSQYKPKDKPPPPLPATEMRVFQVKHANARDLARTIEGIWKQRLGPWLSVSVDERSNSVIVMATAPDLDMVGALLAKLDTASSTNRSSDSVRVLPLSHTRADTGLMNALGLILAKGSFQVDPARNQVIVSGDPKALEAAEKLLQYLDTRRNKPTSAEVQVRLVWLASGLVGKEGRKPPEDMKPVVAELAKMGIEEPSLVTQTLVAAMPDTQFRVEGLAGADSPYRLSISGKLQSTPGELANRLQMSIVATQAAAPPGPPGSNQIGRLETEITAPPNHFVVLGMTPTATTTSVFVVQILPKK